MLGDVFGLVDQAAAYRASVDLDETDEVRIFTTNEMRDVVEHTTTAAQVAGAGERKVERWAGPGGVADVVGKQAQA